LGDYSGNGDHEQEKCEFSCDFPYHFSSTRNLIQSLDITHPPRHESFQFMYRWP
jgi:hypothetical protein